MTTLYEENNRINRKGQGCSKLISISKGIFKIINTRTNIVEVRRLNKWQNKSKLYYSGNNQSKQI